MSDWRDVVPLNVRITGWPRVVDAPKIDPENPGGHQRIGVIAVSPEGVETVCSSRAQAARVSGYDESSVDRGLGTGKPTRRGWTFRYVEA